MYGRKNQTSIIIDEKYVSMIFFEVEIRCQE
jgi:hypothetical protein